MLSILSKQMTEPKRLMNALRTRPLETPAMAALNDVLRVDRGTMEEGLLFMVVHESEKALQEAHDEELHALLTEIHSSANWEVQTPCRATYTVGEAMRMEVSFAKVTAKIELVAPRT